MEEITIRDIARICGVGVSTVSRAINNHPDINPETKETIMRVIKENNYVPNNSARNLKRQDAKAIAVLVKGINNSFFSQMIKVLEEEIKEKSYSMVLQHVDYDDDEVEVALKLVKEKRLRGIIFLGGYLVDSEEKLAQLHVPFILSTTGMLPKGFSRNTYSSVTVDDTKESYKMVDYLCKNGHKDIAILCARKTDASIGKLRLEGYKKALKDNGIEVREELILPMRSDLEDYSLENGYMVTKEFLEKQIPCTAIFAISDMLAIGAGKALSETNVPILIIHGDKDCTAPVSMAYSLYHRCRSEKELFIVHGADHAESYRTDPEKYKRTVSKFLKKYAAVYIQKKNMQIN